MPNQLPGMGVSHSEHHLQPRAPSRSPGHRHAEVVLRLQLHVGLIGDGGTSRRRQKGAAANKKNTFKKRKGQQVMRKQGQGTC